MSNNIEYDLQSDNFFNNPFPTYAEMRKNKPFYPQKTPAGHTVWWITRYDDCKNILADSGVFTRDFNFLTRMAQMAQAAQGAQAAPIQATTTTKRPLIDYFTSHLLLREGKEHRKLKHIMSTFFTKKLINSLKDILEKKAEGLMQYQLQNGMLDVVQYSNAFTIQVISHILGVSDQDGAFLLKQISEILTIIDATDNISSFNELEKSLQSHGAATNLVKYFDKLCEAKLKNPQHDLISTLLQFKDQKEGLAEHEIYSMVAVLIIAGYTTTAHVIPSAIHSLLLHPEQLKYLQQNFADEKVMTTAINEFVRFCTPVMGMSRWTTKDVKVDSGIIKMGDIVMPNIISANRDETVFEDAEKFNVKRDPNPHIAFGYGDHLCAGMHLAQLEIKVVIRYFLSKFSQMQFAGEPDKLKWQSHLLFRGLESLPIRMEK